MKTETWLPLITLALGWAGAQATEMFRDRRTSSRERKARQAELQHTTLLNLQDAILEVSWSARRVNLDTWEGRSEDAAINVPEDLQENEAREAREHLWRARDRAQLLASRVQDAQAHEEAFLFLKAAYVVATADREASDEAVEQLHSTYVQVIDTLGALICERYKPALVREP